MFLRLLPYVYYLLPFLIKPNFTYCHCITIRLSCKSNFIHTPKVPMGRHIFFLPKKQPLVIFFILYIRATKLNFSILINFNSIMIRTCVHIKTHSIFFSRPIRVKECQKCTVSWSWINMCLSCFPNLFRSV